MPQREPGSEVHRGVNARQALPTDLGSHAATHRPGNLPATTIPSTLIPAATHTVEA